MAEKGQGWFGPDTIWKTPLEITFQSVVCMQTMVWHKSHLPSLDRTTQSKKAKKKKSVRTGIRNLDENP